MGDYDEDTDVHVALQAIATQLKYLGNGDASTPMGALEAHGKFVSEAIEEGLSHVASAISEHSTEINGVGEELGSIASALYKVADALGAIAKAISHDG